MRRKLAPHGFSLEPGDGDAYVLRPSSAPSLVLKLLAAAAPHHRGGRGSLGLHWMLRSDTEDYVAVVDLSREAIWLLKAEEFRTRAQPLAGGRFHLDWLVLSLGPRQRSQVPSEDEFQQYRLENQLRSGL